LSWHEIAFRGKWPDGTVGRVMIIYVRQSLNPGRPVWLSGGPF
jgi:hypothetical protein